MTEDEDALIQAALTGQEDEPETNIHKREVKAYIGLAGIKAGPNPIPFTLVWEHFKRTMPEAHTGRKKFAAAFREFFTPSRNRRGMFYRLDPIALGLPLSYSVFTDKMFYKNAIKKSRKYGKEAKKDPIQEEEQKRFEEYLQAELRETKNTKK